MIPSCGHKSDTKLPFKNNSGLCNDCLILYGCKCALCRSVIYPGHLAVMYCDCGERENETFGLRPSKSWATLASNNYAKRENEALMFQCLDCVVCYDVHSSSPHVFGHITFTPTENCIYKHKIEKINIVGDTETSIIYTTSPNKLSQETKCYKIYYDTDISKEIEQYIFPLHENSILLLIKRYLKDHDIITTLMCTDDGEYEPYLYVHNSRKEFMLISHSTETVINTYMLSETVKPETPTFFQDIVQFIEKHK